MTEPSPKLSSWSEKGRGLRVSPTEGDTGSQKPEIKGTEPTGRPQEGQGAEREQWLRETHTKERRGEVMVGSVCCSPSLRGHGDLHMGSCDGGSHAPQVVGERRK